jgi:peptide/nickel transport system ATP-binding protein
VIADARLHRRPDRPPVLAIDGLTVEFAGRQRVARVIDGATVEVWPGEIVGLIGESGSGKTMTALSILGLLPRGARITAGDIRLSGTSLRGVSETQLRAIRGDRIAMIPQNPMSALNPVLRIGMQVGEPYVLHRRTGWKAAITEAIKRLADVHLPSPAERAHEYPHQFSGGMQQRAMTAMAIALEPELLVADEPTTALDVTIQAQVLQLLREIRDEYHTAMLFITHDLGVVAEMCDWVYVMYAGRILEQGSVERIFARPGHPYTQVLLRATPTAETAQAELVSIPGSIPSAFDLPSGCRFADRCPYRFERCDADPPLLAVEPGHTARCWLVETVHD